MKQIKKTISILLFSASMMSFAQVSFGLKANMLFQTDNPTWTNIKSTTNTIVVEKGKNNTGFNIGLSAKVNTPFGIFIQPELYYTTFNNKYLDPTTETNIEVKNNRVDLPVLVGYNLLGKVLGIYAGPVATYNLSTDNQWNDFKENATKQFTVGYQMGAQLTLSKLVFTARYEGALSKDTRNFISSNVSVPQTIKYDNRQSLLLFGLGVNF
jgi:hypothetical protein